MTVLGRGLVFQQVLVTHTCTYNSNSIITLHNIDIPFHKKIQKRERKRERERERGRERELCLYMCVLRGGGWEGQRDISEHVDTKQNVSICGKQRFCGQS